MYRKGHSLLRWQTTIKVINQEGAQHLALYTITTYALYRKGYSLLRWQRLFSYELRKSTVSSFIYVLNMQIILEYVVGYTGK